MPVKPVANDSAGRKPDGDGEQLRQLSTTGVLWGALGTVFRALLQIVSQIILARLLGPELYGLFAVALVVVLFSNFFADAGLAHGLIQKENVTEHNIRFVFTWQMTLGFVLTALIIAIAPWAGNFYGDQRLTQVLQWLALTCLINGLGATAQTLLRRRMDFRTINLAAVISYAIGFLAIGIPLALAGMGEMSLVIAFLIQTAVAAIICLATVRHSVRPLWRHAEARWLLRFGVVAFSTSLVNWVLTSLDRLVIGRFLNVAAAGLYATMSNFILSPSQQILMLLQNVLYSAGARVQDEPARLANALKTMIGIVALVLGPVFISIAVVAPTIVQAIYGSQWAGGEAILAPLSIAVLAYLVMGMATPILWNSGQITVELKRQIPIMLLWIVVLPIAASYQSIGLLAWLACGLYFLRASTIVAATLKSVSLSARADLPTIVLPGMITSAIVATSAWLTDYALRPDILEPEPLHAAWRLIVVIGVCAIALPLSFLAARAWISEPMAQLLRGLVARAPGTKFVDWFDRLLPQATPADHIAGSD